MRKTLLAGAFSFLLAASPLAAQDIKNQDVYQTLEEIESPTHWVLESERYIPMKNPKESINEDQPIILFPSDIVDENHEYIDDLVNRIASFAPSDNIEKMLNMTYRATSSEFTFRTRLTSNTNGCFRKTPPEDMEKAFRGHTDRIADSFQLSLIYLDIAKKTGYDLDVVRAKELFFLKPKEGEYFNPLTGSYYEEDVVKRVMNIDDKSIDDGVYLTSLRFQQIQSIQYARIAWFLRIMYDIDFGRATDLLSAANELYETALKLDPHNIDAYRLRGQFYNMLGNFDYSMHDFSRMIELDSTNWRAHALKGQTYLILGSKDKAIEFFKKAYKLNPDECEPIIPDSIYDAVLPRKIWA